MSKQFWRQINLQYNQGRFCNVSKCSGLQALFAAVFYTSVDLLCKNSYERSVLVGYFDCFQSNHTVGCCNINFRSLCQIKRGKMLCKQCLYIFLVLFCATAVALLPRLANFSPCDPQIFFSPTLYAHSLLKIEFFFECSWVLFEKEKEKEIFSLAKEVSKQRGKKLFFALLFALNQTFFVSFRWILCYTMRVSDLESLFLFWKGFG